MIPCLLSKKFNGKLWASCLHQHRQLFESQKVRRVGHGKSRMHAFVTPHEPSSPQSRALMAFMWCFKRTCYSLQCGAQGTAPWSGPLPFYGTESIDALCSSIMLGIDVWLHPVQVESVADPGKLATRNALLTALQTSRQSTLP